MGFIDELSHNPTALILFWIGAITLIFAALSYAPVHQGIGRFFRWLFEATPEVESPVHVSPIVPAAITEQRVQAPPIRKEPQYESFDLERRALGVGDGFRFGFGFAAGVTVFMVIASIFLSMFLGVIIHAVISTFAQQMGLPFR